MASEALDELLAVRDGTGVCWLGNDGWLIRSEERTFATDLDLSAPGPDREDHRAQASPVSAEELAPVLDVHFISHEHGDHFNAGTCEVLARRSGCLFVLPRGCVEKARAVGIPQERTRVARPGEPFELPGVRVEPLPAHHSGHPTPDDCGYLLTTGGRSLLQPGDTALLEDHLRLEGVDALFVSPTGHNMHVGDSARLIEALRPSWAFPQHFGTYVQSERNRIWTEGFPDEVAARLPDDLRARFHRLAQGEVFVIR